MKLRKLFAGVVAAAVTATSAAAIASANEAFLMYTDDAWAWGCWSSAEFPAGVTEVTGDGTYTVYIDSSIGTSMVEDEETGELVLKPAAGAMVFCVDIADLANDLGCGKAAEAYEKCETTADKMALAKEAGLNITDLTITTFNADCSTADIAVDQSKIIFGDIEGNGKIRIEIQNEYGDSKSNPCIDKSTIAFDEKIAVTFTITGIDKAEEAPAEEAPAEEAPATGDVDATTDSTKGSPDTGVADVAAVAGLAVLAGGAFIVAKKRK